jgi:hypothetical protein
MAVAADTFTEGMAMLELCFRDPSLDKGALQRRKIIYAELIGDDMTDQQWVSAVRRACKECRFFPRPAELMEFARPRECQAARAADVYQEILDHYERGHQLAPRDVLEAWGPAARDAFVAAGGQSAFAWCEPDSQPFRLKAFQAAWFEVVKTNPLLALPQHSESVPSLPSGTEAA